VKERLIISAVMFVIIWMIALYAAYGLCPEGQRRFCDRNNECKCYPYRH
jgi:hypothetical protein